MSKIKVENDIEYLRLSSSLVGASLSDEDEELLRGIILKEVDISEVISEYIFSNKLETIYTPVEDELAYYPGTTSLVNYFNIKDRGKLKSVENFFVNVRSAYLFAFPLMMRPSFTYLEALHENLFSDLYPSAGMIRTISASSKNTAFCRPEYIEENANLLFEKLANDNYLKDINDRDKFLEEVAYYMGELEVLHPFRDGNMRVIMLFVKRIIKDAGYEASWNSCDVDRLISASIAAIDGDYPLLVDALGEIIG